MSICWSGGCPKECGGRVAALPGNLGCLRSKILKRRHEAKEWHRGSLRWLVVGTMEREDVAAFDGVCRCVFATGICQEIRNLGHPVLGRLWGRPKGVRLAPPAGWVLESYMNLHLTEQQKGISRWKHWWVTAGKVNWAHSPEHVHSKLINL